MHSGGYLQGAGGYGHSESAAGPLAHYPGWNVVAPSTPLDAFGLYRSAFRMMQNGHHVPTIMLDPKASRNLKAPFFPDNYEVPIGQAEIVATGKDITLFAWGNTFHHARVVKAILEKDDAAIQRLRHEETANGTMPMFVFGENDSELKKALWLMQGRPPFSAGLVNLRTLVPFDKNTCSKALRLSRGVGLVIGEDRRLGGIDASIADQLIEANLDYEPVVYANGAKHGRPPYGPYNEPHILPQLPGMVQAALNLID
jgi:pyruvate/2-oxoglutarate/acetoin dehydrogenase E1 component